MRVSSGGWIRTTVVGTKIRSPAVRRRPKSRETLKQRYRLCNSSACASARHDPRSNRQVGLRRKVTCFMARGMATSQQWVGTGGVRSRCASMGRGRPRSRVGSTPCARCATSGTVRASRGRGSEPFGSTGGHFSCTERRGGVSSFERSSAEWRDLAGNHAYEPCSEVRDHR
jgi:hypothetical protein